MDDKTLNPERGQTQNRHLKQNPVHGARRLSDLQTWETFSKSAIITGMKPGRGNVHHFLRKGKRSSGGLINLNE